MTRFTNWNNRCSPGSSRNGSGRRVGQRRGNAKTAAPPLSAAWARAWANWYEGCLRMASWSSLDRRWAERQVGCDSRETTVIGDLFRRTQRERCVASTAETARST